MKMKISKLVEIVKTTGFQVFYNHTSQDDVVKFPYIIVLSTDSDNLIADNNVYSKIDNIQVILHTYADAETHLKDEESEEALENVFAENCIPWQKEENWLEDYMMYQIVYNLAI